jgi:hypothetical protein
VGTYRDNAGVFHGFLLAGSQFTTIDPPDSRQTELVGINDFGQIVGRFSSAAAPVANFLRTHGVFVPRVGSAEAAFTARQKMRLTIGAEIPRSRRTSRSRSRPFDGIAPAVHLLKGSG